MSTTLMALEEDLTGRISELSHGGRCSLQEPSTIDIVTTAQVPGHVQ